MALVLRGLGCCLGLGLGCCWVWGLCCWVGLGWGCWVMKVVLGLGCWVGLGCCCWVVMQVVLGLGWPVAGWVRAAGSLQAVAGQEGWGWCLAQVTVVLGWGCCVEVLERAAPVELMGCGCCQVALGCWGLQDCLQEGLGCCLVVQGWGCCSAVGCQAVLGC